MAGTCKPMAAVQGQEWVTCVLYTWTWALCQAYSKHQASTSSQGELRW